MMKKLELQQWALLAEVIGGIAVVISIIFLVLETRENTNAIQAQTYQNLTEQLNNARYTAMQEDIATLRFKLLNGGYKDLSDKERWLLRMMAEAKWGIYESAYYAYERGILGDDEWQRFENAICRNYATDHQYWDPELYGMAYSAFASGTPLSGNVTPVFRSYVETLCPQPVVNSDTPTEG